MSVKFPFEWNCTVCGKKIDLLDPDDFTPSYFAAKVVQGPRLFDFVNDLPFCGCICSTKWFKDNNGGTYDEK